MSQTDQQASDIAIREQPHSTVYETETMRLQCYDENEAFPTFAITFNGIHLRGDSLEVVNGGATYLKRDGRQCGCITRPLFGEWPKAIRQRLQDHAPVEEITVQWK